MDDADRASVCIAALAIGARQRIFHYAWMLIGASFATPLSALAQSVINAPLGSLTVERWGMEAGLASNWVRDIAEDEDGVLWVVSHGGLSRFDGRQFTPSLALQAPAPLGDTLSQIERTRDGRLWVGLEHGGVRLLVDDRIEMPPTLLRTPAEAGVRDLAADEDGSLWVGTGKGLWHVSTSGSKEVALGGRTGSDIAAVAHRSGTTWVRTRTHGLWQIDENIRRLHEPQPSCEGQDVAAGQTVLVTACNDGAWQQDLRTAEWVRLPVEPGISLIFVDRRDRIWFGSRGGLVRMHGQQRESRALGPLMTDARLRAFHEDARGDVWVGSFAEGAVRLHVAEAHLLGQADGLSGAPATSVLALADGTMLSGAFREGLQAWHARDGRAKRWRRPDGLPGDTVWALARDDGRGGVWVGGDEGLRWFSAGKLHASAPDGIRFSGSVRLVYVDPEPPHVVWISGADGVHALGPGSATRRHGVDEGLDIGTARFFHRRRDGRLVAGGVNGLFVFGDTRWHRVSAPPLHLRALTAATEDTAGTLWMTGDLDGLIPWRAGRAAPGPTTWKAPFSPVHSLIVDGTGDLWASGNEGVARIAPPPTDAVGAMPALLRLGRREGLDHAEANGWGSPSVWRTLDGVLLYPAVDGVIRLDPSTLGHGNAVPRAVRVQHVRIAGGPPRAPGDLVLATGERSLALALSAIAFEQPESIEMRYRLDGFDNEWVRAGPTREAAYPRLASGRYRFRLQARIGNGPWVEGKSLSVTVAPRWYERRVVQGLGLVLALAAAGGWILHRQRLHTRHLAQSLHARDFLRSVIDALPHPLFVRHPDGRFVLANAALSRLYGMTPGELENEVPAPPLHARGFDILDRLHARVLETGEAQEEAMVEIVDAGGFRHWLHVAMRPFRQRGDRGVEEVIGAAEDITDTVITRAGLEERERLLSLSREEARDLAGRLLDAQEEERRAIARELHDDYTQRLAGLAMMAWSTQRQVGREGQEAIGELAIELERIAKQMQQASRELHPPELEGIGLVEALRLASRMFGHRSGLEVAFSMAGEEVALPEPVALAAYRIVQQALQNTLSHAGTREARLSIRRVPGSLIIEVVDTGRGFDPAAADATPGLGLASMRERARLAGISLTLDSRPGEGTRVSIVVPAP